MSKKKIAFFLFFAIFMALLHAGIISRPRLMNVISTEHFDIIFSAESTETAKILSRNVDELYHKAKETVSAKNEIKILIVISPDSDVFSASYSPTPYNRIVIYDAPNDFKKSKYDNYEDFLLNSVYREVLKATAVSIRTPFIDTLSKIFMGDALQPARILNLPFSFVEGIASLEDENKDFLDDKENLKILIRAKQDGNFPSWIDAAGSQDIYPADELSRVAGIAFAAYLQQRYGLEKYIELWHQAGNIHFVYFTKGIFFKVYGETLENVWQDFADSIPYETENSEDDEFIPTPYGFVLYDKIRCEVSLYGSVDDPIRRHLLFFADNILKMDVDESGRFLKIEMMQNKMRENLHKYQTLVFDLETRSFLSKNDVLEHIESDESENDFSKSKSENYFKRDEYKIYNPLKYMFHGTWIPLIPIRDLKTDSEEIAVEYWPGLGLAYTTQADPLENNKLFLSASAGFLKLNFQNITNPTATTLEKYKIESTEFTNDFSAVVLMKNTTTPVDVSAGGIFKFTKEGQYSIKAMIEANFTVPIVMPFQKLSFDILSVYRWSTRYNGVLPPSQIEDLPNWIGLNDSYRTYEISMLAKFSNIHQAGISPYEKRGFEVQAKFYSLWDYEEIESRAATSNKKTIFSNPSLVSFSIYGKLCFPRTNPLPNYNGWILCVPANISISVLKDKGTALSTSSQIILIGKEIQRGFSLTNLYLNRFSISLGYIFDLDYTTRKDLLPDIRSHKQFTDVFSSTFINDKISIGINFVFSPVIGHFSRIGLNADFNFIYGLRTNEIIFSFDMKFNM